MMKLKFLGEEIVDIADTPFKNYKEKDWALYFIERYGQIDGSHHKSWVLDQVARILCGTPVVVKVAKWSDGDEEYHKEYRISSTGNSSKEYESWASEMRGESDEYEYDIGVAP